MESSAERTAASASCSASQSPISVRLSADDLPAVALTAFAMECDRQAALAAGFQRHVTKPISLLRLSEAVAGVHADRPVTQDRGG